VVRTKLLKCGYMIEKRAIFAICPASIFAIIKTEKISFVREKN